MSTDRDTTRLVRSWLEEGVTALPDGVLDAVLDQVPATPQRRPWWPARRYAEMNIYAKLAAAAVALVIVVVAGITLTRAGGVGSTPTGVPSQSPSPAATSAAPGTAAPSGAVSIPGEFTACVPSNTQFKTGTDEQIDAEGGVTIERRRGFTWKGSINATDARFTGTHYYSWDGDGYRLASGKEGQSTYAEGHRIENADGSWTGSSFGVNLPDGTGAGGLVLLTGEGAYQGLTAVLFSMEGSCFFNFRGIVTDVPAPPVPYTGS